jgi:4-hydroxy-3-polyprenylbenzoate decarboxylase
LRLAIGITGASGAAYACRLLERLLAGEHILHVTLSRYGDLVWQEELGFSFQDWLNNRAEKIQGHSQIIHEECDNLLADPAWGSKPFDGYVVVPCSGRTFSAIANGNADNLITRFGDVALKEKRPLVLVIRETPLHVLHLERLRNLAAAGAIVLPACPGFYSGQKTFEDLLDFMVDKILSYLPGKAN